MTQKHRSISLIVIHCSATRVTQDFTFEQLEACHLARGFKSIGYHYYITKDGVVYPGRPESEVGAHARHYNAHSIGICYEERQACRYAHSSPESGSVFASGEPLPLLS